MASETSSEVIVSVSFRPVPVSDYHRPGVKKKGLDLLQSGHVLNVSERFSAGSGDSVVHGSCIRETSVTNEQYKFTISVSEGGMTNGMKHMGDSTSKRPRFPKSVRLNF